MDDIHAQAKSGIKALMVRQVFLQIFTFGGVILARVLAPAQFGLFAIASFWVGIIASFGLMVNHAVTTAVCADFSRHAAAV